MPLGKDLAYIRKSQNLTLEDIQNEIKIPLSTLKSIEDESIFGEKAENPTYRRSFIRSYAKVLKIDDKDIVQALNAMEAGTYHGDLLSDDNEIPPKETDKPDITAEKPEEEDVLEDATESTGPAPVPPTPPPAQRDDAVRPPEINWADMGRKFSPVGRNSKTWLVLILIISISVVIGAGYFFSNQISGLFDTDPAEELATSENQPEDDASEIDSAVTIQDFNETEVDNTTTESGDQAGDPISLQDTLTVAVYAAYGQLEPVRVTSDFNWRTNPFWMEEGEAYNFDFKDTLLVRGQYSRMLLLFNGHPIDNPRQNYFDGSHNSVVITRSILNQRRYLDPPPEEFPLEVGAPDSIIYRIQY